MTPIEQGLSAVRVAVAKMTAQANAEIARRKAPDFVPDDDEAGYAWRLQCLEYAVSDLVQIQFYVDQGRYKEAQRIIQAFSADGLDGSRAVWDIIDALIKWDEVQDEIREAVASLERVKPC